MDYKITYEMTITLKDEDYRNIDEMDAEIDAIIDDVTYAVEEETGLSFCSIEYEENN